MTSSISSVVAKEGNGNIQITFTIPFALIKEAKEEATKELAKDVEVPGFRRGMAPVEKAAEKIADSKLVEHALSHLLPKALAEAIQTNKLKIAVYPRFELVSAKDGEPWQIRGTTCELPPVELGDYKKAITGASRAANLWTPDKGKPEEKHDPSQEEKEAIVVKSLLENIKVQIPAILIEKEADSRLSSLLGRLEKLGLALENYLTTIGKKAEDLRADYAKQAHDAIALDLILTKVAESENIKVEPKEIESAISMSQAAQTQKAEDLEQRKRLIESILKRRKALDLLISLT